MENQIPDRFLQSALKTAYEALKEDTSREHRARTPDCLPVPRFDRFLLSNLTGKERAHIEHCQYCLMLLRACGNVERTMEYDKSAVQGILSKASEVLTDCASPTHLVSEESRTAGPWAKIVGVLNDFGQIIGILFGAVWAICTFGGHTVRPLGCNHERTTFPLTKKGRTYVACLNCGKEIEYDWARMHPVQEETEADKSRATRHEGAYDPAK